MRLDTFCRHQQLHNRRNIIRIIAIIFFIISSLTKVLWHQAKMSGISMNNWSFCEKNTAKILGRLNLTPFKNRLFSLNKLATGSQRKIYRHSLDCTPPQTIYGRYAILTRPLVNVVKTIYFQPVRRMATPILKMRKWLPPRLFNENRLRTSRIILFTHRQTDRQTRTIR